MSGNPVKIGGGCATVTGYKLPQPLVRRANREGGSEVQARSQDIGLAVLVMASQGGEEFASRLAAADFSVKEKDEASPLNRFQRIR